MESSKNSLSYDPLNREKEEFRLLNLKPSHDFDSIIECSLFTSTLKKPPRYEALSYVWGAAHNTISILVNGENFEITTNLETALRYLRDPLEARVLWIDAICINQLDIGERSHQVTCMKDIYKNCWQDLLWLGIGDETMDRGMKIAEHLQSIEREADKHSRRPENPPDLAKTVDSDGSDDSDATDKDNITHEQLVGRTAMNSRSFLALKNVFVRPLLWERVWIMQEIAYAPQPVLIAGHSRLPWTALEKFLNTVDTFPDAFHDVFTHGERYHQTFKTTFSTIQAIQHQRMITRNVEKGQDSHLLDVLARFQSTSSTDPRDKLFALLALSSDPLGMKPDYSASKRSVFTKFATAYINHSENLDILCQSRWGFHTDEGDILDGIPSWVPDFEQQHPVHLIFAQRGIFSAGGLRCKVPCNVTNKDQLIVEGVSLGELSKVDNIPYWKSIPEWMTNTITAFETSIHTPNVLSKTENVFQALWRTLLTDCFRYPMRRLKEEDITSYGSIFTSWIRGDTAELEIPGLDLQMELWPRKFATTKDGLFCLTTLEAKDGDFIVVLGGAKVPVVLRRIIRDSEESTDQHEYILVGPAYVHGFMDGEAMTLADEGKLEKEEFVLK